MPEIPAVPETPPHPLEERIYLEAGHWVRLGNTITWSMGSIFVPLSLGGLAIAVQERVQGGEVLLLAGGSLLLFSLWVYVSALYRASVRQAREVLVAIEEAHGIPRERSFYFQQGQPGFRGFSLFRVQIWTLILLWTIWIVLILETGAWTVLRPE